jgi:hypothetical protein
MGLMRKLFGGAASVPGAVAPFQESRNAVQQTRSRNGPRRDLVKLTLRETMRKHGIPAGWIDCRALSVLTPQHKQGMHVQFLVRQADRQLLAYVHAFQESFWEQILRVDPHARQWLFSVGWEFHGEAAEGFSPMPDPASWEGGAERARPENSSHTHPGDEDPDALASDLAALHAAISGPAELADVPAGSAQRRTRAGA